MIELPLHTCECEHMSHFPLTEDTPTVLHGYGTPMGSTNAVKTLWGTFHVCDECKATCLKNYAMEVQNG